MYRLAEMQKQEDALKRTRMLFFYHFTVHPSSILRLLHIPYLSKTCDCDLRSFQFTGRDDYALYCLAFATAYLFFHFTFWRISLLLFFNRFFHA